MRKYCERLMLLMIFSAVFVLQSCLFATSTTVITPEIRSLYEGEYKIDPYMKDHVPRYIAVLPFTDTSGSKEGATSMRLGFYNHFSALPFRDMELYKIDDLLTKAGLTDPAVIRKTSPQELGRILGVDAVVLGEVSDFDKFFAVLYSQVAVGAEVKMYDTKTGNFLWSGKHKVRKHEGGISTNPVGIIATVIVTALNVRDIQLLRANDDLFRDMVKTIPTPTLAEAKRPPMITLLTQDSRGLPKKAGDEIKVVIQGTPKMQAYFDIGLAKRRIEMQEVETGGYYGVYKVVPGDNITKAVITGYLTDDSGNTTQWVDAVGQVTLDTTPPDKPASAFALGRNKAVSIRWAKSGSPDLAGYRVYRSQTPLTGYIQITQTEWNEYLDRDKELVNVQKYYYRIAAVDFAGNESELAQTEGMPVTPGPTFVSGVIDTEATWYAGASPYILTGDVTIKDKALLTIEPGTTIKSQGGALIIEGRIDASGDNDHIISFDSAEQGKLWEGIVFANVKDKENVVKFVHLQNARTAIFCRASSPKIEMSEFTRNEDVFKIAGSFSKPLIMKNTIYQNRGSAISVTEGAAPRILENTIHDNHGAGLWVQGAAPEFVSNSVARNKNSGIVVSGAAVAISSNNIVDNKPFNMTGDMTGSALKASNNWWGSTKPLDVMAGLRGRIEVASVLDAAHPQGKPLALSVMERGLSGTIKSDAYLILSNSPYRVTKDVMIDGGATLYIEPGVVLEFEQGTSLITEDGGIIARGTKDLPITFTAAAASPSEGFYTSVIRLLKKTRVNSSFAYCIVKYATTAFDIYAGSPEISNCHISYSSQCAVFCRNDAAPVLVYNTFNANRGEGAVKCVGMANPKIHRNNFTANTIAIQSFSSIYIDARYNWWGTSPPDPNMIWGDNINIKPWLPKEGTKAFREKR